MRDQTKNIGCHAHHVSFEENDSSLVLQCCLNEWRPLQTSGINFYHTVVYLFHTSGFFERTSGHFFYTADQLSRTSEPSRENGLKLKPRGCHTEFR